MNLVRRLGSLPGVRRLALHPPVRRALASVLALRFLSAARLVEKPLRLVAGEITARGTIRTYRVKGGGLSVAMQHGRGLEALF